MTTACGSEYMPRRRSCNDYFHTLTTLCLSLDAVSYEELQQLYHAGHRYRGTLFTIVTAINAGTISDAVVEVLGDNLLVGLGKPDGSPNWTWPNPCSKSGYCNDGRPDVRADFRSCCPSTCGNSGCPKAWET